MKLHATTEQRQVLSDLMAEAHMEADGISGAVPALFSAKLESLVAAGHVWVDGIQHDLFVGDGCTGYYKAWRRNHRDELVTIGGRKRQVPAFAGRKIVVDGAQYFVQQRFFTLDLAGVREFYNRHYRLADAHQGQAALAAALLPVMESDSTIRTAGDAIVLLDETSVAS